LNKKPGHRGRKPGFPQQASADTAASEVTLEESPTSAVDIDSTRDGIGCSGSISARERVKCWMMDMFGKTLPTIGAAWLCLLFALLLFDYVQSVFNGEWNLLFAGWSLLDIAILAVPGIALVVIGTKIANIY
jgi:hypothetical protein